MKRVSTMALGLMLALGTTTLAVQPVAAQKEKKQKEKPASYSPAVRAALAPAQEALKANDLATAAARIAEANAAVQTDDDRYATGNLTYELGRLTKDNAKLAEGIDLMLASNKVAPEQLASFYTSRGKLAYQMKDMPKAETSLEQALQAGSTDPDILPVLVEAKNANGKLGEALALLEKGIKERTAAGQPVPVEWYGRGINLALAAKPATPELGEAAQRLTQLWVAAYPTKNNWRDTLMIYRDLNHIPADIELDMYRLLRTIGGLKGERDYMDYISATYLRFPAEASAVLTEGVAAGMINPAGNRNLQEIADLTKGKVAADKAALNAGIASAKSAANGRSALSTADAFLGYNEWQQAIDLYKVALAKGGVDTNVVNTRLGMALVRAGQKDAAKQAFAQITGPRAALAKYWTIYIDKPVAG
ncbi:hypothetical protein CLG96_13960 [Sphingomonas oleivorans]|uniref:Uncharacterized protein n=1 Tax=Sphingomonas oleivorans TaxID=1735121 RepID=A0A2T5FWQ6_9SPHN|nr:hypothetical protein [Sphingomonas oleivorans]PTQ10213.1 hypothetical protein CLG96_13960 [Sphingomonas oleivorans]